jgi:hypothetical protein
MQGALGRKKRAHLPQPSLIPRVAHLITTVAQACHFERSCGTEG